jgi:hypothetical protein
MAIPDSDMPQLFRAADAASRSGQRTYLRLTRLRLGSVVGAAASGIAAWRVGDARVDLLGLLALLFFVGSLLFESALWKQHPERDWYDGRAVAESAKTLAWKFAVGGDPFPTDVLTTTAMNALVRLLDSLHTSYPTVSLTPEAGTNVTPWMTATRGKLLTERREIYIADRVKDQQDWYKRRYDENNIKARAWKAFLIILEALGVLAALVESLTDTGLRYTPVLAAGIGAVVAWLETKQHDQVARAYSAAVSDLASALVKLQSAATETDWAREMNDAEEAISREHTLWLASRSYIDPGNR